MPSPQLFINPGPGVSPSTPIDTCQNEAAIGLGDEPDQTGPWTMQFTIAGFKPSLNINQDITMGLSDDLISTFVYVDLQYQTSAGHTVLTVNVGEGDHQIDLGVGYPDGDYTVTVHYDGDNWQALINNIVVGSGNTGGTPPTPFTKVFIELQDFAGDGVLRMTSVYGGKTPP